MLIVPCQRLFADESFPNVFLSYASSAWAGARLSPCVARTSPRREPSGRISPALRPCGTPLRSRSRRPCGRRFGPRNAGSIRNAAQVRECAEAGADIATIPFAILKEIVLHPGTQSGIDAFTNDLVEEYTELFVRGEDEPEE